MQSRFPKKGSCCKHAFFFFWRIGFETSSRSMPLSSQSIFHTLLIELTFMVHKISIFLKHMPSPQPGTWCVVPCAFAWTSSKKIKGIGVTLALAQVLEESISVPQKDQESPLYGGKKKVDAVAQEGLFALCKIPWALVCMLGGTVCLARPSLSAVRCCQGGCRRGTVITEYPLKMEQNPFQTPSYLIDQAQLSNVSPFVAHSLLNYAELLAAKKSCQREF